MNLRKMLDTIVAYRAGAPLGDVVVMKVDAYSLPAKSTLRALEKIRGYAPEQDLAALRVLPNGTLGREYARHLDANGIEPLVISPAIKARFHNNPYALRYATTHDLHHVLSGFDTGLAGEAGAAAFNVGQASAPVGRGMLWVVRIFYGLLSPTQARRIWHNIRVGLEMGRKAKLVIAEPIESRFAEPLERVRADLGIPDPKGAGVLPSGHSVVADWFYQPMKKKPA
jgi:ubiquinone biosynthesis protein COQ4